MVSHARTFCAIVALLALSACQSAYSQFYKPIPDNDLDLLPFNAEPSIGAGSGDERGDVIKMYEQGYGLIGVASFVGASQPESAAIEQARVVHAAVVLISSKYRNTATGAVPLTLPTSTIAVLNGTVNAFGSGGTASGNYSGSTTTYGTQTTYIPYSVDKYEQAGLFFAALERKKLGVMLDELSDEQRGVAGTNRAMRVTAVRTGSPAFLNDILAGDLLLSIGGRSVYDSASVRAALAAAVGHQTEFRLIRGTAPITKSITVPVGDW